MILLAVLTVGLDYSLGRQWLVATLALPIKKSDAHKARGDTRPPRNNIQVDLNETDALRPVRDRR